MSSFEEKFKEVYGKNVLINLKKYNTFIPEGNMDIVKYDVSKFEQYTTRINNIKNFYKNHPQYTRFILITIERFYGVSNIDFSEKNDNNSNTWETEHIIPKETKVKLVHSLGNLTLISRELNGCEEYKVSNFKIKKKLIKKFKENDFFINSVFNHGCVEFNEAMIENRGEFLIEKFENIFKDKDGKFTAEKYFEKVLNYKGEEI